MAESSWGRSGPWRQVITCAEADLAEVTIAGGIVGAGEMVEISVGQPGAEIVCARAVLSKHSDEGMLKAALRVPIQIKEGDRVSFRVVPRADVEEGLMNGEPPDFEQIAREILATVYSDPPNGSSVEIVEQLRQVWNARGAADIQAVASTNPQCANDCQHCQETEEARERTAAIKAQDR